MDKTKRDRLEAKGWKVGEVGEFLGLTTEEAEAIKVRLVVEMVQKQEEMAKGMFGAL